jgi:Mg-chelatase subunit ChlD/uncharacterized membrane protein
MSLVIRFSHPHYLLLLPLVWGFLWWVLRGSLADLGRARARLAAGVRAALLTLLVLALAGMQLVRPTHTLCTVFVVDVSDSIARTPQLQASLLQYIRDARARMRQGDQLALVAFAAEALLDHAPEDRAAITQIVATPSTSRTDIAAGIQLAMASFPPEAGKQIVLFTDGNENLGHALEQAGLAAASDVHIAVVPLQRATPHGEALLRHISGPATVKVGAPFPLTVVAEALAPTDGTLVLTRDGHALATRTVHLRPGTTVIPLEATAESGGLGRYTAVLNVPAAHDTVPDNNAVYTYVRASGQPTVLVVEGRVGDGMALAQTLAAHKVRAVVRGPDGLPATLAECAQYDSVVLANVPAWQMAPTQQAILRAAVRDTGMGLAMVGGPESFGAGGYYHTPVEEALPVTMDVQQKKTLNALALVIVIDISGSMSMTENGVPKIRLAGEAAQAAVDLLQPIDQVCVIGFDTRAVYVVKMQRVENKGWINHQIQKLSPGGGGIVIRDALRTAYKEISGVKAGVRHVIVCADADDTEAYSPQEVAESYAIARRMRAEKISMSMIGFGTRYDSTVKLQQDIAAAASGNWYLAERMSNLPQIFSRDIMLVAKSLLVEQPFRPLLADDAHEITRGVPWDTMPPLRGYVATSFRSHAPTASLLLTSPVGGQHDPIAAAWGFGLGRSVAFTSDASGHWGAPWLGWNGYGAFWPQAVRWTLRRGDPAGLQTTVTQDGGRALIAVDAVDKEGNFGNLLDLRAHVSYVSPGAGTGPQTTEELLPLEQTAPGRYEAAFEPRGIGAYVVAIEARDGTKTLRGLQTSTLVIPYSPEFQRLTPNTVLLRQIARQAHGVFNPLAKDIFGKLRFGSRTLQDLWPLLLALLAILFLADVAIRRVLLPWEEIRTLLRTAVQRRLPAWSPAAPAPERTHDRRIGTLLDARKAGAPRGGAPTDTLRKLRDTVTDEPPPPTTTAPTPAPPPPPSAPAAPTTVAGKLLQKKREREQK